MNARLQWSGTRVAVLAAMLLMLVAGSGCAGGPPEGKIAFTEGGPNATYYDIYVMNIDGSNKQRLVGGFEPDWSPDGTRIVFATRERNSDICVINVDGTNQQCLTTSETFDWEPAWSPDGSRIAFASERDGNSNIYTMNTNGTDPQRLTTSEAEDGQPTWSPDGSRIAFISERDGDNEIYVMNADGSDVQQITSNEVLDIDPAWSPDGSRIAFVSRHNGDSNIYVMNIDGSDLQRLTSNARDSNPTWSPDGRYIAHIAVNNGISEIHVMKADGSNVQQITSNELSESFPAWAPAPQGAGASTTPDGPREAEDAAPTRAALSQDAATTATPATVALPIDVHIVHSSDKGDWLEVAVRHFAATNPTVGEQPVEIILQEMDAEEAIDNMLSGDVQPTVFSPSASLWLHQLRSTWQDMRGTPVLLEDSSMPQSLIRSPLVVVAWQERAEALWPAGTDASHFWPNIHNVLTDPTGWGAVGHPEWGVLNMGHTNPDVSTSGLQTLVLLTAAYHNKSAGLTSADVVDAGFQEWLDDFEMSVPQFADSDEALLADMLQFEPSKYDLVLVDEHATIDYLEATRDNDYQGTIGVFYPPATVFNDHPYAILNTRWVTPEEQEAAALFHDFLLDDEMQRLALRDYSFRPANETIELDTLDSPLGQFASYGLQTGTVQAIEVPPVDVLVELDNLWVRNDYP